MRKHEGTHCIYKMEWTDTIKDKTESYVININKIINERRG